MRVGVDDPMALPIGEFDALAYEALTAGSDPSMRNRIDGLLSGMDPEAEKQADPNAPSRDAREDALREAGIPEAVIARKRAMAKDLDQYRYPKGGKSDA